jgi:hypothetical protein
MSGNSRGARRVDGFARTRRRAVDAAAHHGQRGPAGLARPQALAVACLLAGSAPALAQEAAGNAAAGRQIECPRRLNLRSRSFCARAAASCPITG